MKIIYYAFVQEIEVPENLTEKEIDNFVFKKVGPKADYIWSDKPDLFDLDKWC